MYVYPMTITRKKKKDSSAMDVGAMGKEMPTEDNSPDEWTPF